jgi:hypothetical protein
LTTEFNPGCAEAIPAPALSDNAKPVAATAAFVLDSMNSR